MSTDEVTANQMDLLLREEERRIEASIQQFEQRIADLESQVRSLGSDGTAVAARATRIREELHQASSELRNEQERMARLRAEAAAAPASISASKRVEAAKRSTLQEHEARAVEVERAVSYRIDELSHGVAAFGRLGLRFEPADDGKLRNVFTCIDPADPDREFSFTVRVLDSDDFELLECSPHVPDADALVHALNTTKDYSAFVQSLRRAFVRLV